MGWKRDECDSTGRRKGKGQEKVLSKTLRLSKGAWPKGGKSNGLVIAAAASGAKFEQESSHPVKMNSLRTLPARHSPELVEWATAGKSCLIFL
jgi:hypothetical protein